MGEGSPISPIKIFDLAGLILLPAVKISGIGIIIMFGADFRIALAKFRKTKAAVKLLTLLDLRGNIPTTVIISLYTILQILSVALFEKIPILQAFAEDCYATENITSWEQLELQGISLGQ